jgi:hypothetical protein
VSSQGGNGDIRGSTITRSTETNTEEMGDIQQVRRSRIYDVTTDEDEDEEGIISEEHLLIWKILNLWISLSLH